MPSFDIVSRIDRNEVDNAVHQTLKEVGQRYDLKGSKSEIRKEEAGLLVVSVDDYKLKAVVDILQSKMIRRGVPLKNLQMGKIESAAGGLVKQMITLQNGIPIEKARDILKIVKGMGLKVQGAIQGEEVRFSGKQRDVLQEVIRALKEREFGLDLQFVNFRE